MTVTTNAVVIRKDQSNLIGISIGGGAPMCPCLYIVQVRGEFNLFFFVFFLFKTSNAATVLVYKVLP